MSTPPTCPDPTDLKKLLDGELPAQDQRALTGHLDTCEVCQQTLEMLAGGRLPPGEVAPAAEPFPAESELREAVRELKAATSEAPTLLGGEGAAAVELAFLSPPDKPGQLGRLGPYEILEVLGRGGMGVVFKAYDPRLDRLEAIKVLAPQLAANPSARKRFAREARAVAPIGHENIVAIRAVDEFNGYPYLVMEYVPGGSLQDRLERGGPLTLEEILDIGRQVAAGLAAAHARGLIHRDIKPGNILLRSPLVKITDFGLARAIDDATLTQSGVIAGTPQYMAPEQARAEAVDHRADLFSLGSVLYTLCTGRPPFKAGSTVAVLYSVSQDQPTPIRELNPAIPEWLEDIIARLHAKRADDRFQSAAEVARLLEQHLAHLRQPDLVPAPPPGANAGHRSPRTPGTKGKNMPLVLCEDCGKEISDQAYECPHCGKPQRSRTLLGGYEYRSEKTLFGLPLVHIAYGVDPDTGKKRVAKGIIAIGDVACGVLALGGAAFGGVALGGMAFGLISFGGVAVGLLLAIAGCAVGGVALGGLAIGGVAFGGGAFGYYAFGGSAIGVHALGGTAHDPAAVEFFRPFLSPWFPQLFGKP